MIPQRIQRTRKKGFNLQEYSKSLNGLNCVYVGRPSKWGNPYRVVATNIRDCYNVVYFGNGTELMVANSLTKKMATEFAIREFESAIKERKDFSELQGKNLSCWCKIGEPCHADVLLELVNKTNAQQINKKDDKRKEYQTSIRRRND